MIQCNCLFSDVAVQKITELDNKTIRAPLNVIVHFCDADWIDNDTAFFTGSSVGNTLSFLMTYRITLSNQTMVFVV